MLFFVLYMFVFAPCVYIVPLCGSLVSFLIALLLLCCVCWPFFVDLLSSLCVVVVFVLFELVAFYLCVLLFLVVLFVFVSGVVCLLCCVWYDVLSLCHVLCSVVF